MAKVKSTNPPHVIRRTLASGEIISYYYAWRGGPRITDPDTHKPLSPATRAFHQRLEELRLLREQPTEPTGPTLYDLITQFKANPQYFLSLSPKTRASYASYLEKIREKFGGFPLEAFDQRGARKALLDWRNSMAKTPCAADKIWMMLKRLFNFGVDIQAVQINPCRQGGRLYSSDRSEKIWTRENLEKLKTVLPEHVWDVVEVALWTGQRQGDLLHMQWSQYNENVIFVEQRKSRRKGKSGVKINIPVGPTLKAILDRVKAKSKGSTFIFCTKHGKPWTQDGFRTMFHRGKQEIGLSDMHFHDLRGTFVLNMAEAGATVPEIASITGHQIGDVQTIIDKYLPKTQAQAWSAMKKLEAKSKEI